MSGKFLTRSPHCRRLWHASVEFQGSICSAYGSSLPLLPKCFRAFHGRRIEAGLRPAQLLFPPRPTAVRPVRPEANASSRARFKQRSVRPGPSSPSGDELFPFGV